VNLWTVPGVMATLALVRTARRSSTGERARRLHRARRWRLPPAVRTRLELAVRDADLELGPEEICELWLGGVLGCLFLVYAMSPDLTLLAAPVIVAAGPVALRVARGRADHRFTMALPGALEQVAAGLRGGASLNEMVEVLASGTGVLAADLRRIVWRTSLGLGLAEAFGTWSDDRPFPSVRSTAGALALAAAVGGRAANALDGLAASLRARLGAIAEAQALSAQARLSALVVGAAPIAYLGFAAITDRGSLALLLDTGSGRICLGLGLVCEAVGVSWMRRIVRDDP
jgi:tight adherence protein B